MAVHPSLITFSSFSDYELYPISSFQTIRFAILSFQILARFIWYGMEVENCFMLNSSILGFVSSPS